VALGVTFYEGNDQTVSHATAYPQDGVGAVGYGDIFIDFASPVTAVAAHHPGGLRIGLYVGLSLVGWGTTNGGPGVGWFTGAKSDVPFNRARLVDWTDSQVAVDNLYVVPEASAGLWGLAAASLWAARRRLRR
jgi:hypothetical protein